MNNPVEIECKTKGFEEATEAVEALVDAYDGFYKKQWVTFDAWKPFYTIKEVIAWMPLPPVYKGE